MKVIAPMPNAAIVAGPGPALFYLPPLSAAVSALHPYVDRHQRAAQDDYREDRLVRVLHDQLLVAADDPRGAKATKTLHKQGIKTNVTLIFTPMQALLAAKAGATYVSPFVGRLDDISQNGMGIIEEIRTIFDNYGYDAEIIVASIRNPIHVLDSALIGADICTIPYSVMLQLAKHPLTDAGIKKFLEDWEKVPK